jgi:hypothetical protein
VNPDHAPIDPPELITPTEPDAVTATPEPQPTLEDVVAAAADVAKSLWAALEPIARAALASFAVLGRRLQAAHDADHERFHALLAVTDAPPSATCPLCSAPLRATDGSTRWYVMHAHGDVERHSHSTAQHHPGHWPNHDHTDPEPETTTYEDARTAWHSRGTVYANTPHWVVGAVDVDDGTTP